MADSANYLKSLVGAPRFELGTSCAQGRRATRLRYAPTNVVLEFTALCDFVDGSEIAPYMLTSKPEARSPESLASINFEPIQTA